MICNTETIVQKKKTWHSNFPSSHEHQNGNRISKCCTVVHNISLQVVSNVEKSNLPTKFTFLPKTMRRSQENLTWFALGVTGSCSPEQVQKLLKSWREVFPVRIACTVGPNFSRLPNMGWKCSIDKDQYERVLRDLIKLTGNSGTIDSSQNSFRGICLCVFTPPPPPPCFRWSLFRWSSRDCNRRRRCYAYSWTTSWLHAGTQKRIILQGYPQQLARKWFQPMHRSITDQMAWTNLAFFLHFPPLVWNWQVCSSSYPGHRMKTSLFPVCSQCTVLHRWVIKITMLTWWLSASV